MFQYIIFITILSTTMASQVIFDFNTTTSLEGWSIVDDVVMGGKSDGNFSINADGHGVFEGEVSLENNGGFSSVRYVLDDMKVGDYTHVKLKIRGDGKRYQFRIKANASDYHSYISYFQTSGEWEEIEIPLGDMYASFRGSTLDMPNFSNDTFEEIRFLIANKKAEKFQLLIDKIELI